MTDPLTSTPLLSFKETINEACLESALHTWFFRQYWFIFSDVLLNVLLEDSSLIRCQSVKLLQLLDRTIHLAT